MTSSNFSAPLFKAVELHAICRGEYEFALPDSFRFGRRVFGGIVMSIVHQAAKHYFTSTHGNYDQPDVIGVQWQVFRLPFPSKATVSFKDLHLGKSASALYAVVRQGSKECMMGFLNMSNFVMTQGFSFETGWKLNPAPLEADLSCLAKDADPRWVPYKTPFHSESFGRVRTYLNFFVPSESKGVSFRDQWITPSDPTATITNETLSFITDLPLPILDNFYPNLSKTGQAVTTETGVPQTRDWENEVAKIINGAPVSYKAPAMVIPSAMTIEIKKRLPISGVKWLFMRAFAKNIKGGRLSMELVILDQKGELVALSQQLCPILDLGLQRVNEYRL